MLFNPPAITLCEPFIWFLHPPTITLVTHGELLLPVIVFSRPPNIELQLASLIIFKVPPPITLLYIFEPPTFSIVLLCPDPIK